MKKIPLLFVILIIVVSIRLINLNFPKEPAANLNTPSPSVPSPSPNMVQVDKYVIYLDLIDLAHQLILIPNFQEKITSSEIFANYKCRSGTNGSFYTSNNQPLGVFYANGKYLNSTVHPNTLFNGFFYKSANGRLEISAGLPGEQVEFLFQSGPMFTPTSRLVLNSDETARRILIGKTLENSFYFITIVKSDNIHSGPTLAELPVLIKKVPLVKFTELLNLDGGSASAFYGKNGTELGELTFIGSFLCLK